ncbi:hypothetical protein GALMADRAFT_258560 [Galerina marginata CBS 339.88]|uniref:Nephrocystin 3-like N-terminal domain-containing protein n=1 Tax=Galerina marginata (strain CBS 339.88) TaxID=685588 RepID=A0A067SK86_GALM3|nr:hypothetical protein GALMADRAFT_258560 [Galerina marginata CBS 339.88]
MPTSMFGSQTVVTGGQFHLQNTHHHHNTVSKDPWECLLEAASPTAFHNSNDICDPPKCHPNTRVAVLNKIMDWIRGLDSETREALIMWLNGAAGSGKSAIARSIAERCYEEGILLASYFFARADPTRNHGRSLIATIAYQASTRFPDIRDAIIRAVDRDPFVFTHSLEAQMLALIVTPLRELIEAGYFNTPDSARVVVIDGLDECGDRNNQVKILTAISTTLRLHRLPLIFLIASRPEHDIRHSFDVGHLKEITTRLALNDDYLPSDDIRLFLQDKFTEIKETHPFKAQIPLPWPADKDLRELVMKSSGQFVYASTVVKFITSSRHRPSQRLNIILGLCPAHREMPFAELDVLYRHILSSAEDHKTVLRILSLLFHSLNYVSAIEQILSLNSGDISWLLCDLTSLIFIEDRSRGEGALWQGLNAFHASLQDFLLDYSRSQEFYIGDPLLCAELAHSCIHYLQEGEKNYSVARSVVELLCNATPTQELLDDLTNFSIGSLLVDCEYQWGVVEFFTAIKLWKFDDGSDVHSHQLWLFDQFALGIMEKMYSDANLTALVTVAKMKVNYLSLNKAMYLFQLHKAQWVLDKLSFSYSVHTHSEYGQFISEFLEDPNRSGVYALNSQWNTAGAVYFLKHISSHSEQILPSISVTWRRKYTRQRNLPWLWRKLVHQAHSSEAAQIVKLRLRRQGRLTIYQLSNSEGAFHLALPCLVHVLPKSDISEELTALARRQKFGPLSRKDAHRKRAVTREIARYLARVDAEDPLAE